MFERFGEFGSCEELNRAAEGQKEEGDEAALIELAKENGIDVEDAEDYMDGCIPQLATPMTAALGRLSVLRANYKGDLNLRVALDVLQAMMRDPDMQEAVMKKGKDLRHFMEILKEHARKHQKGGCGTACATDRDKEAALRVFYTGTDDDLKAELEAQRARLMA